MRDCVVVLLATLQLGQPVTASGQNRDQHAQLGALAPLEDVISAGGAREGARWLAELLESTPDNSYAWFRLGTLTESLGRHDEAARAYRRASDFVPYAVWGLHHSARMEARAGRTETAIARLREAFERGYADHAEVVSDPSLRLLRGDAEFERLLAAMMNRPQPQIDLRSSWSPDGRQIVFSSSPVGEGSWDLFIVDADGNNLGRLTSTYHNDLEPSWSPSGEWIAFARVEALAGSRELYVIRPDGTDLTRLTGVSRPLQGGRKSFPSWAPSGDRIVVSVDGPGAERGIYVMDRDGSAPRRLTDRGSWPNLELEGGSVLFDEGHLWRVSLSGGAPAAVYPDSAMTWWASSLSPTGTMVASSAFPRGARVNQVAVTDLSSGSVTFVTPPTVDAFMPSWSPDGRQIVFAASRHAFGHGGRILFLIGHDGSGLRPLVNQDGR